MPTKQMKLSSAISVVTQSQLKSAELRRLLKLCHYRVNACRHKAAEIAKKTDDLLSSSGYDRPPAGGSHDRPPPGGSHDRPPAGAEHDVIIVSEPVASDAKATKDELLAALMACKKEYYRCRRAVSAAQAELVSIQATLTEVSEGPDQSPATGYDR